MRYQVITYRNIYILYNEKKNDINTAQFMVNTKKGIRARRLITYELSDFLEGQYPSE